MMNEQTQPPVAQPSVQNTPTAQAPVSPPVEEPKESSNSPWKYVLIALGAVLLLAAGAGVTYWFMKEESDLTVDEVVEDVDTTTEESESDIEEETSDEVVAEDVVDYESVTYTCPVEGSSSVIILSEYPGGVTVAEEDTSAIGCRYRFSYEDSSLVLGYELGETFPTDLGIEHVEIDSTYVDSLCRVTTGGSTDYIYAVIKGENPCYQDPVCDAESPYYGDDGQYLYSPGLITGGIAHVFVSDSDNAEEVLEVFDYIAAHTSITRSE